MMIHEITEKAGKYKSRKRVGRGHGSGSGKTCGRGHKGAGSRAGFSRRPSFEGGQMPYFRRIAKRGFTNADFKVVYHIVNLASLQERFETGATVDTAALVAAGLVRNFNNPVKVLGQGDLSIVLHVTADKFSASAAKKIEDAGGSVTVILKKKWTRDWSAKTKANANAKAKAKANANAKANAKANATKVAPASTETSEPSETESSD